MKEFKVRGRKFDPSKLNPKVFKRAAEFVLRKHGPHRETMGGCAAVTKACVEMGIKNSETHKRFLDSFFEHTYGERVNFFQTQQFRDYEYGNAFYWGPTENYTNQKARAVALLTLAEIVKGLQ